MLARCQEKVHSTGQEASDLFEHQVSRLGEAHYLLLLWSAKGRVYRGSIT